MLFAGHLYLSENKNDWIYPLNWTPSDGHRNDIIKTLYIFSGGQRNWEEKGTHAGEHLPCFDHVLLIPNPNTATRMMQPTIAYNASKVIGSEMIWRVELGVLYRITGIKYLTQGACLGSTTMQA